MNIESAMIWIWLAVVVLSFILETMTQDFVSIWFTLGALMTLIFSSMCNFWVEIIIFSMVSLISIIATRPLVKKFTARQVRNTNTDEYVGKRVKVEKEISKYDSGEVKINGIVYTAILMEEEEKTIPLDSIVEIVTLKGNKVVVRKLEE